MRRPRLSAVAAGKLLASAVLVAVAAAGLAVTGVPSAMGAWTSKITNSTDTAATNPYFNCSSALIDTNLSPYFAYRFGEASGTAATDASANANTGLYQSAGVTYGQSSGAVCPRDVKTAITLNGSTGYVSGPNTAIAGTNVFTEEIWFKTTVAAGKLIGFGSSRTGSSSNYDRHLYIDTNGKLEFGVYPSAVKTVVSPATVTDGSWHFAAATLSTAGMALYLDGKLVASDTTVTTAQVYNGYWRIGYDNLSGWTNVGAAATYFFTGSLADAAVYTKALTSAQIAQQYAAASAA